jgi:hypothetical protein
MPMRTYQLLLQGIAALCMAHASIAQEKIAVLVPAMLDPSAPIVDSVKRECNVESMIGNEVFQRVSEKYPGTAQFQNPGQAGDGYVLKVTITSVIGAGGGAWSGRKAISIRADVLQNSNVAATKNLSRESGGGWLGGYQGTCSIMDRIAVALGKDVAAWMPSALMVIKYAPEPAAQPASQSASQLAPEPAKEGATPPAAEKPAPAAEPKQ